MSYNARSDFARYDGRRNGNDDDSGGWNRPYRMADAESSNSTPRKRGDWQDRRNDSGRGASPRREGDRRDASYRSVERSGERHWGRYKDTDNRESRDKPWSRVNAVPSSYRMRSPGSAQRPESHSSNDSDYARRQIRTSNYGRDTARGGDDDRAHRERHFERDRGQERRREFVSHLRSPGRGSRATGVDNLDYGASRNEDSPRRSSANGKDASHDRMNGHQRAEHDVSDRRWSHVDPYTTESPPVKTLKRKTSPQAQEKNCTDSDSKGEGVRSAKRALWSNTYQEKHPSSESAGSDIRHSHIDTAVAVPSTGVNTAPSTSYDNRMSVAEGDQSAKVSQTTMIDRQCPWPFEVLDAGERRLRKKDRPVPKPLNERRFIGCSSIDQYDVGVKLGQGTFGEVKKATHFLTGVEVALKKVTVHEEKDGMPITAIREIKLLKRLQHPAIVPIVDMAYRAPTERGKCGEVYMVEPYMDHDLNGMLENPSIKLNMSQIKLYMKQLFEGTLYLHQNKILHRDMKAANLLINNKGQLQIADFGLARPYHDPGQAWAPNGWKGGAQSYTGMVVTRWYRPPELLAGDRRYGPPIDMWGLGCILAEMIVKQPLFKGTSEIDQMLLISKLCGSPDNSSYPGWSNLPGVKNADPNGRPDQEPDLAGQHDFGSFPRRVVEHFTSGNIIISSDMADLLDKLLVLDPKRRMTAQEALEHRWFWQLPFPADPKSMPEYQASKELDRQRRDQQKRIAQQQQQQRQAPPPPLQVQPQMRQHTHGGPVRHTSSYRPPQPYGHSGPYSRNLGAGGGPPPSNPHGDRRGPYPNHPPPSYGRPSRPSNPYADY